MDLLPLEVLNKVAENRTLYVLAASTTWQHCIADTAEYVETAECRVELRFESPESEDSTQTCLYKKVETGMDLLPLEVLNKIAENRTLYVLAASTTVSVGWRGSFNQNWMWWNHCNVDTAEYVETAECRVQPRFESPESEDSTQTCFYKKARDKEISIKESLNRNGLTRTGITKYNRRESDTIRASSVFNQTVMDLLALEFLNIIAENQTLYLLAASSTVSVGWRGSFNQNWMWWHHCNADTAEYVETAECRVEPRFESPESEDSTQSCLYKKAGDKEISI
ncbi:hypothetical protein J6590_083186 [Homalodisca vitripennis]|nr:hypothetical protein J6590_083186 [Homalodisca vitripennis]